MKSQLITCALALAAAACQDAITLPPAPTPLRPVIATPAGQVPDGHPDLATLAVVSRGPRRLSVDQLERSIEQVGQLPAGSVKFPESLALTLGRPDYVRLTDESLDPSPLFMKFMLDLGAFACKSLGDADPTRPAEDRILTRYPDVAQNLDYILLRFTGIEDDANYRARLERVYHRAGDGMAGWQAVCIAVFTSPEFLLY